MNLSDNSENSNDEVQLIKLQDSVYAFANNYITKIIKPQQIKTTI
jgi:hypothetical protein